MDNSKHKTTLMDQVLEDVLQAKTKTKYPLIHSVLVEFNLDIKPHELHEFREAVLHCIPTPEDRQLFSNEDWQGNSKKTITRYPVIQFRQRNGHAAIWAMQAGVPMLHKFIQQYKQHFKWRGKNFGLALAQLPAEEKDFCIKPIRQNPLQQPPVYHLFYYIPFTNENYDWYKANRNLPDVKKTKKLEELLTAHLCSFIHYAGGFIPGEKIKLTILDKKPLDGVQYKSIGFIAYEIRYTVNLNLPNHIAIGNKCSHGFGWQVQEETQTVL